MNRQLALTINIFLIFMMVACVGICIFWFPEAVEYVLKYLPFSGAQAGLYALGAVIALPLLAVIGAAFRFPSLIVQDAVFTPKTAKLIKHISFTLFIDCAIFAAAVTGIFIAGERLLSPALGFIAAIGFTVALMLYALADYVGRAAALKEEADYTL